MGRTNVSFLAWAPTAGRARDLAGDLGGVARTIYPARLAARRATPLRYVVSALATVAHLVTRRPRAVVVQNPPIYPALLCLAYARMTGSGFVLDNHPAAFGATDNAQARRMLGITRVRAAQAYGVLVTTESWAEVVRGWGGRPLVLHEAPPRWQVSPVRALQGRRPRVLFACVYASDEPVAAVIEAGRLLPGIDITITGDPRKAPASLLDDLPSNVHISGWLDQQAYAAEVDACDVLLALTTEPTSVMRAAYEAGYAGRVLVMSDTRAMRPLFPEAVVTDLDPESLAESLTRALEDFDRLVSTLPHIRDRQHSRWADQRTGLLQILGLAAEVPELVDDCHAEEVMNVLHVDGPRVVRAPTKGGL